MPHSRERLLNDIRAGGSIGLPDGRTIAREEDLPPEAELAQGNLARLQAEADRLDAELAAAKARKDDHHRAVLQAEARHRQLAKGKKGADEPEAPEDTPPAPGANPTVPEQDWKAEGGGHAGIGPSAVQTDPPPAREGTPAYDRAKAEEEQRQRDAERAADATAKQQQKAAKDAAHRGK